MPSFFPPVLISKTIESKSIDLNNGTITQATISFVPTGEVNDFDVYLTADGVNWELVITGSFTKNLTYTYSKTFTNTGTDLRWKIVGHGKINYINIGGYH